MNKDEIIKNSYNHKYGDKHYEHSALKNTYLDVVEEAMDIWAKQIAIEFACWLNGNGYDCFLHTDENVKHWNSYGDNRNLTTEQLYELFIQSKK